MNEEATPPPGQGGPPLAPLGIVVTALFMSSLTVSTLIAGGATFPSPFGDEGVILEYFSAHSSSVLVSSLLQFAASIPLAVYAATASARLGRLGIRAPGATIALVGGTLASGFMGLSALLTWALTRPEILDNPDLVRLLHDLAFITGGPGFTAPLGLLLAGIAVPGLLARLLPSWLAWAGLVIAGLAELSLLSIAIPELAFLLPIVRFPALAWIIVVGFRLPRQRVRRTDAALNVAGSPR